MMIGSKHNNSSSNEEKAYCINKCENAQEESNRKNVFRDFIVFFPHNVLALTIKQV